MSHLLPGHGHRSPSDRLLNNYLSSQKQLTTALLTLLSHSHSSTSSLLAYVTSSSGVSFPVRRAVTNAGFEGPLSANAEVGLVGSDDEDDDQNGETGKWTHYIRSLESFRKELKEVHRLEEELSQVKRDREILVSRLIKATKARPSKSELQQSQSGGGLSRSNGSVLSFNSDMSGTTAGGTSGRSKRAARLAEAQAEVLGCEEHLRALEVRLEEERSKVMRHGLLERFQAMEDVGRMWIRQARLGIAELRQVNGARRGDLDGGLLPPNAYEVESNGSLAPSQSASQVGYGSDGDLPPQHANGHGKSSRHRDVSRLASRGGEPAGSVTGSIAEEDEGSSGDDERDLVVHENQPKLLGGGGGGGAAPSVRSANTVTQGGNARIGAGGGVPSIREIANQPRRRTQSEIGMGYNPPSHRRQQQIEKRQSLRRTYSNSVRSDDSSIRKKKKGGFFRSIAKIFKGPSSGASNRAGSVRGGSMLGVGHRRGDESPPLTSRNRGGWHTRTDANIKSVSSIGASGAGGFRRRNNDDSSDDDEPRGVAVVTNMGNKTWSVDQVGRPKPSRTNSQSTLTPAGPASGKTGGNTPSIRAPTINSTVSRTNTVKSTASTKRTRPGSISAVQQTPRSSAGGAPSIASVIENAGKTSSSSPAASPAKPRMMEVPKAPKSQVTPSMYQATAPPRIGDNLLVSPPPLARKTSNSTATSASTKRESKTPSAAANNNNAAPTQAGAQNGNLAPLNLGKPIEAGGNANEDGSISTTPLPPSKSLQPPAKSAMRGHTPAPAPAFIVSAPGPVVTEQMEREKEEARRKEQEAANAVPRGGTPATVADTESVYESAVEEENAQKGHANYDSESEASDSTADPKRYQVVENDFAKKSSSGAAAQTEQAPATPVAKTIENATEDKPVARAPVSVSESAIERRKSVRMAVPDSPATPDAPTLTKTGQPTANGDAEVARAPPSWSSRVGQTADSTDEEDNSAYVKAKQSLTTSSKRMSTAGNSPAKTTKKKTKAKA